MAKDCKLHAPAAHAYQALATRASQARETSPNARDWVARDWVARGCIAAACQQVHAGKLAARQLAMWVAGRGVNEADFRLLWQLFAAAETALASAAKAGRGESEDAPLEPAILDQATLAERLAASPAHVSATVERLSGLGLISPISLSADRRRQCWQLTFAGRELVLAVLASVAQTTDTSRIGQDAEAHSVAPSLGRVA